VNTARRTLVGRAELHLAHHGVALLAQSDRGSQGIRTADERRVLEAGVGIVADVGRLAVALVVGVVGYPREPRGDALEVIRGGGDQARRRTRGHEGLDDLPHGGRKTSLLDAIRNAEDSAGNAVIKDGLEAAGQQIAEGKSVTAAFQEVGLFPPLVVRMLRVGESTGALDTALLNVSYFYNREVKEEIGRIQVLIEPAMTVVMGLLLGWVMLSVLGPIYDTITKIKF